MGVGRKLNDYDYFINFRNQIKQRCGLWERKYKNGKASRYDCYAQKGGDKFKIGLFQEELEAMKAYDDFCHNVLGRDLTWLHFPARYSNDKEYDKYGFSDSRSQYYKNNLIIS